MLRSQSLREPAAVPPALRQAGLHEEAMLLADRCLWAWAEAQAATALTWLLPEYPVRWRERLGDASPPALWRHGSASREPAIGIVGSRAVDADLGALAFRLGRIAAQAGFAVVTGGAVGCDAHAAAGAWSASGDVLKILPSGLVLQPLGRSEPAAAVSLAAPGAPFSIALAMERNMLIYAAAEATVVVHARPREGGTWHGATAALRKHMPVVSYAPGNPAHPLLTALGAIPLESATDLISVIALAQRQPYRRQPSLL